MIYQTWPYSWNPLWTLEQTLFPNTSGQRISWSLPPRACNDTLRFRKETSRKLILVMPLSNFLAYV